MPSYYDQNLSLAQASDTLETSLLTGIMEILDRHLVLLADELLVFRLSLDFILFKPFGKCACLQIFWQR